MSQEREITTSAEIKPILGLILDGKTAEARSNLEDLLKNKNLANHLKLEAYGHLIRIAGESRELDKVPAYVEAIKLIPIESEVEKYHFAECLYSIGAGWLYLGNLEKAIQKLNEALNLSIETKNEKLAFYCRIALLETLRHQGKYEQILEELAVMEKNPLLDSSIGARGSCSIMRGDVLRKQGFYREALVAYEKAREIYGQNKNSPWYHYALWALGTCYAALEDKEKAIIYLELASHNSKSIQFWRINILANLTLAELYTVSGDYNQANSIYEKVAEQVGRDENTYYGKRLLRGLAFCLTRSGSYEKADEIIDRLVLVAVRDGKKGEIMRLRLLKAEVLLNTSEAHDHEEARKMLEESLAYYSDKGVLRHKGVALEMLARLDSRSSKYNDALKKIEDTMVIASSSTFDRLFLRAALAKMVLIRRLGMNPDQELKVKTNQLINQLNARPERVILSRFHHDAYESWTLELNQLDEHGVRFVNEFFEDFHFTPIQSLDMEIDRNSNYVREKHLGEIPFHNKFTLMRILLLLAESPGKEFSKEDLAREIWGQDYNPLRHDNNIYININRLRKLLEPNPRESRYIMNGSRGYYFNPAMRVNISSNISKVAPRSQGLSRQP
jgi:tetratricopeptide (TPR) repeat protein